MSRYFTPDGIECDYDTFARYWGDESHKIVAKAKLPHGDVSTVYLGMDHSWGRGARPLIFETMIFGGPLDQEQRRYSTRSDALAGHQEWIDRVNDLDVYFKCHLGYVARDGGRILAKLEHYEEIQQSDALAFAAALQAVAE